ncbi:MAG: ATP-binding protein [Proteobacteria bacterium]|nr:ATP-binding protein [Pseudomonadota bacterium]
MIQRNLESALRRLAASFPIVAVTGARQAGKTTLVKSVFSEHAYVTLEDPQERAFAEEDPKGFLSRFSAGAIFDEAQRWPDLFSHLQTLVDADRRAGRFILAGSQHFGLMAGISQSLAGRVGMTRLLPLSLSEVPTTMLQSRDTMLLRGGYPGLYETPVEITDWMSSYVATYVERDVRQILDVKDLAVFQKFLKLCAGRTGQVLNLSTLAGEVGISHTTARSWISVLESSDLIHLLPPYHQNFGKRVIKSPKLYFHDVGLACWLLGIRSAEIPETHPARGSLFETLIVGEFLKARFNAGQPADLYFWRDASGREADLVYETPKGLQSVEIKSGQTVTSDYIAATHRAALPVASSALPPVLIYGGTESYERSGVRVVSWTGLQGIWK